MVKGQCHLTGKFRGLAYDSCNLNTHIIINRQSKLSFDEKIQDYQKFNLFSFNKETIKFTKPIYVGFCVIKLSKLLVYEWCYDKMQP